jgi:uncharacterized membrane protein
MDRHPMNLVSPVTPDDLQRMRTHLDVGARDGGLSRFWALLLLAILGTVLAVVTGDRSLLVRSTTLVVAGAGSAIAVGYVLGALSPFDVVAASNGQVAGRVNPRTIDLVAALATGTVGAFAQCREDVSDTLPGVAVAISLVPPLTVVGLTLEAGEFDEAAGALLLFGTNVAAILLTGCLVMVLYGVHRIALDADRRRVRRGRAALLVAAFVIVVVAPLTASTARLTAARFREADVLQVARTWAEPAGWSVVGIDRKEGDPIVTAIGPLPAPDPEALRRALEESGVGADTLRVRLVPEVVVDLGD